MSESQNYEEVTVTSDGITVIKTFEADAFPVPAIAFRIKSERTEPVTVTLVDDVPEEVAVEDLGFHPEYGSEFWTIEDDEITFEREVESEEQYTTVYGIRATGTEDVEQFLTEPTIEDVDPPLEDEDNVVGTSSDVVRDVISGDTDSVPGLDEEEAEDEEDIETLDLADPNGEGGAEEEPEEEADAEDEAEPEADEDAEAEEDEEPAEESEADEESKDEEEAETESDTETEETAESSPATTTNGAADVDSVAAALADEIRAGQVADDDLELLADELDLTSNGAVEARVEKLQTEVSELDAYVDALEEFLEENGTGQDIIDDVQSQLEDVQGRMQSVQSEVSGTNERVDSLGDTVSSVEDDLQSLKGDVKDLDDDVSDLESDLGEVDGLEDRLDDIDEELEDLQEWRDTMASALGGGD